MEFRQRIECTQSEFQRILTRTTSQSNRNQIYSFLHACLNNFVDIDQHDLSVHIDGSFIAWGWF